MGIRELPEETQAALGLQHEKVMKCISESAKQRAEREDVEESVKKVAPLMKSLRPTAEAETSGTESSTAVTAGYTADPAPEAAAAHKAPAPVEEVWKSARTPQGHTYYFNLRTKESRWDRPKELGGPVVFTVGAKVEVWSHSCNAWGKGTVEKVDDVSGKVVCDFSLPNGQVAKKELPAGHKDLRLLADSHASTENFTKEEEELYKKLFESLPGKNEKKGAKAIADLLIKSGAKKQTLRQVWAVVNPGLKQELEYEDFARCCRLVAHCQVMGLDSQIVDAGERPLRVELRSNCLFKRPSQLPVFDCGN